MNKQLMSQSMVVYLITIVHKNRFTELTVDWQILTLFSNYELTS